MLRRNFVGWLAGLPLMGFLKKRGKKLYDKQGTPVEPKGAGIYLLNVKFNENGSPVPDLKLMRIENPKEGENFDDKVLERLKHGQMILEFRSDKEGAIDRCNLKQAKYEYKIIEGKRTDKNGCSSLYAKWIVLLDKLQFFPHFGCGSVSLGCNKTRRELEKDGQKKFIQDRKEETERRKEYDRAYQEQTCGKCGKPTGENYERVELHISSLPNKKIFLCKDCCKLATKSLLEVIENKPEDNDPYERVDRWKYS